MNYPVRSSVSFGPSFGEQVEVGNVDTPTLEEIRAAVAKL